MKTIHLLTFLSIVTLSGVLTGCGGKKVIPVSERIAKVWTASKVDETSVTVYTRGATSNVRDYSKFKLDLGTPPTIKLTDYDGNTFTGLYSVPTDTRLVLTSLNPLPTGVINGTIEFTIDSIEDNNLKLTRTTPSQKTGNTTNAYTLTNP